MKKREIVRRTAPKILIYLISFAILFLPQKIGERLTSGQQYELTGMVLPLAELVEAADPADPADAALLSSIDRVIDVDLTREGVRQGKTGINLFWGEPSFQRDYDADDFAACKKAYYSLILRYPSVFLRERIKTFAESHDLLMDTTKLFSDPDNPNYTRFREYPLSGPLSEPLRNGVLSVLELRDPGDHDKKLPPADPVYSVILPLLVLAAATVVCAVRRKWFLTLLLGAALCKAPLIFLTAPSRLFMYYYPVYLAGYFLLCCLIRAAVCKKAREKEDSDE